MTHRPISDQGPGPRHPMPADAAAAGEGKTEALRALAESTSVAAIMCRVVVCLAPEARVDSVTEMFLERGISSAPVVNEGWQPMGMVSKTDLLRAMSEDTIEVDRAAPSLGQGGTVRALSNPVVLSLHEEAPISVAAALMAYEGVHRLPVLAANGEVVGIVSTLDIVKWAAKTSELSVGEGP